jgi:hypothetical protein
MKSLDYARGEGAGQAARFSLNPTLHFRGGTPSSTSRFSNFLTRVIRPVNLRGP